MNKDIAVIGIGMDGDKTLTAEAREAIESAELIIGARRMVKPFERLNRQIFISYDPKEIAEHIKASDCQKIAVLMSGDCGFYSGTEKLLPLVGDCRVISGISSPVYFFDRIGIPWQDCKFVSLHGAEANIVRNVCSNEKVFFLLGGKVTVSEICRRLCECSLKDAEVYIGEDLAAENEKISSGRAADFTEYENANLCVMVVINHNYERSTPMGISDDSFIRGKIPMTKSEVRAVCISKLAAERDSICWDIGCGTGSVTVEMALQCTDGRVYAVDKSPEAAELTRQNAIKFGCDNISVFCGQAEEEAVSFPAPQSVFIGGSGGKLSEIMNIALSKNPYANIVITAVTLETLNRAVEIFTKADIPCEISQIAVTRTRKVGSSTMLSAENPIFIISGARQI